MVWLLKSQGMKNCKTTKSFCLSILTIYSNDLSTFWHVYCCHVYFVFCEILKYVQAKSNILRRAGPPGLAFCGSGLACLPSWLGMVNAGLLSFMQLEIFLQIKFIIFQGCPIKQAAFLHGQPTFTYSRMLFYIRFWS